METCSVAYNSLPESERERLKKAAEAANKDKQAGAKCLDELEQRKIKSRYIYNAVSSVCKMPFATRIIDTTSRELQTELIIIIHYV